jgi:predicted Zn-dependent protease
MGKVVVQFVVLVALFFSTWYLLSHINFMKHIDVNKISKDNEKKIGDLIMQSIKKEEEEIEQDSISAILNGIKNRICKANNIDPADIKLHLMVDDNINAFALPDKHLVINTGLIAYCDSATELTGVMAHEIAHIQHNHILKKMLKETGISILISASGGNSETIKNIIKHISSTAFDRKQESEADNEAVRYMLKAHISPYGLAHLMERLSKETTDIPKSLEWLSTHPNSKERAMDIQKIADTTPIHYTPVLTPHKWSVLKIAVGE